MSKLNKGCQFNTKKVEPKKGQQEPLSNNSGKSCCPFLRYDYIEGKPENINRAFDILFEAVIKDDIFTD